MGGREAGSMKSRGFASPGDLRGESGGVPPGQGKFTPPARTVPHFTVARETRLPAQTLGFPGIPKPLMH